MTAFFSAKTCIYPGSSLTSLEQFLRTIGAAVSQALEQSTHAKSLQSCLTLRDAADCTPLASSVHGISQAQILEWVPISSSDPEMVPVSLMSPALAGGLFTTSATWGILNKGCALFVYSQQAGEGSMSSVLRACL